MGSIPNLHFPACCCRRLWVTAYLVAQQVRNFLSPRIPNFFNSDLRPEKDPQQWWELLQLRRSGDETVFYDPEQSVSNHARVHGIKKMAVSLKGWRVLKLQQSLDELCLLFSFLQPSQPSSQKPVSLATLAMCSFTIVHPLSKGLLTLRLGAWLLKCNRPFSACWAFFDLSSRNSSALKLVRLNFF